MKQIPTEAQFGALASAFERYETAFREQAYYLEWIDPDTYTPLELNELAKMLNTVNDECRESSLCQASTYAFDWLESAPAFQMARSALFVTAADGFADFFEKALLRHYQNKRQGRPFFSLERSPGLYLHYTSRVALACHNYLTGKSVRAALNGAETIARMNQLLCELKQLSTSDWIEANDQRSLLMGIERLDRRINRDDLARNPVSKRNDADLASRLMAAELIQLHEHHFGHPAKRAIFQLMGLPFIEKPLEMRTIERLIKTQRKPKREISTELMIDTK